MAARMLVPFFDDFFQHVPWSRKETDVVVPHQASLRGVSLLWRRLGFRQDQLFLNLAERGNCLAASTPLALAEAVHSGRIRRGNRVVLAGSGAGLSVGGVALTY
jgi:3-oxoacyl-[acyl-carrier-protein] synthase-3